MQHGPECPSVGPSMKWHFFSYVIVQNKIVTGGFLSARKEVIGGERRNIIDGRDRRQMAGGYRDQRPKTRCETRRQETIKKQMKRDNKREERLNNLETRYEGHKPRDKRLGKEK